MNMKIERLHKIIRDSKKTPVSLNVYFAEVIRPGKKKFIYKKVYSPKFNDMLFRKYSFYKTISKMP